MKSTDANSTLRLRSPESIAEEKTTRALVAQFLVSKGYMVIDQIFNRAFSSWEQIVYCTDTNDEKIKIRVRVVWRSTSLADAKWAAVQLGTRQSKTAGSRETNEQFFKRMSNRDEAAGVTHSLFIERRGDKITTALLIPSEDLEPVWHKQRAIYANLIETRCSGRVKANPALNGSTPTLSVRDQRTDQMQNAAEVVWQWPSIVNLLVEATPSDSFNDSFDDCPIVSDDGRDQGVQRTTQRSEFQRNATVRRKVRQRANGTCENTECMQRREWQPFLDVHHTLGVEKSDRIWTCVALCPNCHRAAHFSPNRIELNKRLDEFARRFKPVPKFSFQWGYMPPSSVTLAKTEPFSD